VVRESPERNLSGGGFGGVPQLLLSLGWRIGESIKRQIASIKEVTKGK
jgi:hypothetical protein